MARVLIIDDDASIREVIGFIVEDAGHQVAHARDGHSALAHVQEHDPDLIVLDMKMPGMDGWEFTRRYRQRYGDRAAILVLTAARDITLDGQSIDVEAVMAKPFDLDELSCQISALLSTQLARRTAIANAVAD